MRLGQSLNLREDLYAWSFLRSMNRDHIALVAFQNVRQAKADECMAMLERAREKLQYAMEINKEANE